MSLQFTAAMIVLAASCPLSSAQDARTDVFDRKNLVAWCIVPFDGKNRGPAERAEMQLGAGEHDIKLLKAIRASGYSGPIGIIGHTQDDVELRLRDNLDGLDWILPQLDGKAIHNSARPKYRTR